jgi:predicted RNA-binding protein with PIN domain
VTFLIDGYNLLFSLGMHYQHARGSTMLEKARGRLLDRLSRAHAERGGNVLVVFDARQVPPRAVTEQVVANVHVRFTRSGDTADDVIEDLIRRETAPRRLTVVSGDRRIQAAARRRECVTWDCDEYLDWLERPLSPAKPPRQAERPAGVSPEEADEWLRAFGMEDGPVGPA